MLKVALRNVRAHLVRLTLSILAVVLGVSFVAGTFALREMLTTTFDGIVDAGYAGDVYLRGADDAAQLVAGGAAPGEVRELLPADLAAAAASADGVEHALADYTGPIVLVGADDTAVVSGAGAPSFALAYDEADPSYTLADGSAPSGPDEFVLETATAEASGLEVGDTTTIVLGGVLQDATFTGTVDLGASMAGATVVFLEQETAAATFAPDGLVANIVVYGEDGTDPATLATAVEAAVADPTAEVLTGDAMRTEAGADVQSQLGFIETFLLIFAGISLFVGAFIISNTFAMTVRQRQREFALLRAVGASPGQVFASILVQAAAVGAIGGAIGIAGGLGLVTALKSLFGSMGMELAGDIPLTTGMVVVSLVVGIGVSVASAALPARRAALVAPVEAMREDSPGQAASLRVRAVLGLVLAGAGAGAVVAAVVQASADADAGTGPLLGLGAVGVVIGVLLLAPVLARAVLGVMAAPFVVALRPLGMLAKGNVTRNPRRTASTASALMIGMALVGGASVLAASTQASMRTVVESETLADLLVQSATFTIPAGAVEDISRLPEVGVVDAMSVGMAFVSDGGTPVAEGTDPMLVLGMPADAFGRSVTTEALSGDLASLGSGAVAVRKAEAETNGWVVGDEVTVSTQAGELTLPVGAIINSQAIGAPIVMSDEQVTVIQPDAAENVETLMVSSAAGVSVTELQDAITGAAAPYKILSVLDKEEFVSQLSSQVDQILVILYALLGLSIVIAILGIINTLALSVIERTREIGLMRAVGLGRLQLAATITIESVLTAVFGTVLGLSVGVLLASGMPTVFANAGFSTLVVPWDQLGIMLAIAVVVGVLAAGWPAVRAARLPVLDAVTVD